MADEDHANISSQHLDILERIEELKQAKEALIAYKNELLSQKNQAVTGSAITIDNTLTDNTLTDNTSKDIKPADNNLELINEIDNQIANIESQLLQYNITKSSLETNLSEAKLSKNLSNFYASNQRLIENEAKNKMENDFLSQCYSLIIYQEQLDYNIAYHDYLTLLRKIDDIRYRYGLVTEIDLDADDVNILHNERVINENINTYETSIKVIRKDTGIMDESKIRLDLSNSKKEYNLEFTIQEFIYKNSGYQQIQNYIRSYQEHRATANLGSYTSYRQTELRIDYYNLQKEELKDSIRAYVTKAINSYEKAVNFREASWKELQVKKNQYNALVTKLKYMRASQLEVAKSLYEKEATEVTYYQSCYESVIWQNILDNHIYGAMP